MKANNTIIRHRVDSKIIRLICARQDMKWLQTWMTRWPELAIANSLLRIAIVGELSHCDRIGLLVTTNDIGNIGNARPSVAYLK